MVYRWFLPLLWLVFIAVWIAMARGGKAVAERESAFSRLSHYGPLAIGIYLIAAPSVPIRNTSTVPIPNARGGWLPRTGRCQPRRPR